MRLVIFLLTVIILIGSFGFSLAKAMELEGGFPESSWHHKYRIKNFGNRSKPDQEIQIDQSKENTSIIVNQEIQQVEDYLTKKYPTREKQIDQSEEKPAKIVNQEKQIDQSEEKPANSVEHPVIISNEGGTQRSAESNEEFKNREHPMFSNKELNAMRVVDTKIVNQEIQFDQRKERSSNDQKVSGDPESSKIRFRLLSGKDTSDTGEASSSTASIIWDGLGIGPSVFKFKTSISGDTYELENTLIDISYTFGNEWTLTLGGRSVTTGKLTITSSDSEIFNSSNVEGSGYFSVLGIEFGIFEILAGYQYTRYAFLEIESESTSTYWGNFRDSRGLYVMGIGFAF